MRRATAIGAAVLLAAAEASAVVVLALPATPAEAACSRPYSYSDGVKGIALVPFAKAEWTGDPNRCGTYMQVSVESGTSCTRFKSGVVSGNFVWDEADGYAGTPYCSAWIRFKCHATSCIWGAWQRLSNTSSARRQGAA